MMKMQPVGILACLIITVSSAQATQRPAEIIRSEIEQAAKDVSKLAEVLQLEPGMTVADVGAGGGAMATAFAKWLSPNGRVYATDIEPDRLAEIRDMVSRERLANVTVLEGAARSTNLPDGCCDAIFMRDVYHHLTHPEEVNDSLFAALKPGGRFAIIDFEPAAGSRLPAGVPVNRGGHGIQPSLVVSEVTASGLRHVNTISKWPPGDDRPVYFLVLLQKP